MPQVQYQLFDLLTCSPSVLRLSPLTKKNVLTYSDYQYTHNKSMHLLKFVTIKPHLLDFWIQCAYGEATMIDLRLQLIPMEAFL